MHSLHGSCFVIILVTFLVSSDSPLVSLTHQACVCLLLILYPRFGHIRTIIVKFLYIFFVSCYNIYAISILWVGTSSRKHFSVTSFREVLLYTFKLYHTKEIPADRSQYPSCSKRSYCLRPSLSTSTSKLLKAYIIRWLAARATRTPRVSSRQHSSPCWRPLRTRIPL